MSKDNQVRECCEKCEFPFGCNLGSGNTNSGCPCHDISPKSSMEGVVFNENGTVGKEVLSFNRMTNMLEVDLSSVISIAQEEERRKDTLAELIEKCGDKFKNLHREPLGKIWYAFGVTGTFTAPIRLEGSTAEEAVAKLWLALNKK